MIDALVGIACQSIGVKHLVQLGPHVSPDELREIIKKLAMLDQAREPASAILRREREWSRGAYGLFGAILARVVMNKTLRDTEASFEKKHARSVASLRLVMTELAVHGYAAKNGKLPSSLSELVPAWLPSVPIDPLGNAPLVYRVTTNSFVLYSVGPDGKDDQGKPLKRGEVQTGDLLPTAL
jgi:hypothetical protein